MKIVAEIGCNHKGSMTIARNMIMVLANYCGVNIVKFQKRNNRELLTDAEYNSPHPNPENSYARTYGEHRDALEFTKEQHAELKKFCEEIDIDYSCSVWDITSAKDIIELQPKFIKIPSAKNNNYELINYICDNFKGEIHISTGMTTYKELDTLYYFLIEKKRLNDVVLYNCVSDYPVKLSNVCLAEIKKTIKNYPGVKDFGFSGHHEGYSIDNMVVCVPEVKYIERHFTLNKNWKGTDHIASLEPDEMRALVKNIKDSETAWKLKDKDILDCELEQRKKLKKEYI
jgi:sialic acid synthase